MRSAVLLVAAEIDRRASIARGLQSRGFAVEIASDGKRALSLSAAHKFKVAILLLGSEQEALYTMLSLRDRVPKIIVLCERRNAIDRLCQSFPQADYLILDGIDERTATNRIVDLMGCPTQEPESLNVSRTLQFGNCRLDLSGHVFITEKGDQIPLTRAEAEVLGELAHNAGQTVSRDRLRVATTPRRGIASTEGVEPFDRSIDMLVARLRRKIEPDPKAPRFLLTVPGVGYRLVVGTHASDEKLLEAQPSGPEIRYITALCCNLIGTVELAVGPDPEGLGRVITSFQNAGTSAITRMGGAIAYATPDQILGIFGFPAAHEDDAERAVIAGLDAVEAIGQILSPRGQPLH